MELFTRESGQGQKGCANDSRTHTHMQIRHTYATAFLCAAKIRCCVMPHQSAVLINFLHVTPPLGSRNVSTMPAASCSANCHQGWWFWSKGWLWLVDRSSSRSCCLSPTSVDPTVGVFIGAPGVSPRKATDVSPRLLLIITFIFSIAFLELSSHTPLEQEYFRSIPTPGVRCGGWGEGDWDFTCCIPQIWAKGIESW